MLIGLFHTVLPFHAQNVPEEDMPRIPHTETLVHQIEKETNY